MTRFQYHAPILLEQYRQVVVETARRMDRREDRERLIRYSQKLNRGYTVGIMLGHFVEWMDSPYLYCTAFELIWYRRFIRLLGIKLDDGQLGRLRLGR